MQNWGPSHFKERQEVFHSLAASDSLSASRAGDAAASCSSSGALSAPTSGWVYLPQADHLLGLGGPEKNFRGR